VHSKKGRLRRGFLQGWSLAVSGAMPLRPSDILVVAVRGATPAVASHRAEAVGNGPITVAGHALMDQRGPRAAASQSPPAWTTQIYVYRI
jgi:hypothetical protein